MRPIRRTNSSHLMWPAALWLATATMAPAADEPPARFACSFDQGLAADLAGGRSEPLESSGVTLTAGRTGRALLLPQGESPAHIAYAAEGNFSAATGTIDFYVRLDWDYTQSTSQAKRTWLDIGAGANRERYYLHSLDQSMVFGVFDDTGTVHAVRGSANTRWRPGEWHRVTCSWDLPRRYLALAFDGVLESDRPSQPERGSWRVNAAALKTIHVGGWGNMALPIGGAIDELRILEAPVHFAVPNAAVPESDAAQFASTRRDAAVALRRLEAAIAAAERAGTDVAYADAVAAAGRVGLWRMTAGPVKPTPADLQSWCAYMIRRCPEAEAELAALARERTAEKVVPRPDVLGLRVAGDVFRNRRNEDVLLVGVRNTAPAEFPELSRFFNLVAWNSGAPADWIAHAKGCGFAGQVHLFWGDSVRAALREHADMRGVDGWCGHNWATGLCVEAERSRKIIGDAVAGLGVLQRQPDPSAAYVLLSAEDEYMCWCDTSIAQFRRWLPTQYPDIAALNRTWGTQAESFAHVDPPRWRREGLVPANRAGWYDWQQFNRARTTSFYAWLKSLVRSAWPAAPVCGGTHLHLADNRWGSSGVDPEGLNRGVNDVIQCETMYDLPTAAPEWNLPPYGMDIFAEAFLDFQRSTSGKPAVDLEFHAWLRYTDVLHARHGLLPANYTYATILRHYLHGIRAANVWVWDRTSGGAASPSSFASSPSLPLGAVEELLTAALDVRRLAPEIIALSRAPRRVGILVSDASFMQIHPTFVRSDVRSPLVVELNNVVQASMFLDTPVGYVTERSIADGALGEYRVILVPAIDHLDDTTLSTLMGFVERGGHLVVTPRSFAYDAHHRPRGDVAGLPRIRGVAFAGLLDEPAEAQLADADFLERQTVNIGDPRTPSAALLTTGQAPFAQAGIKLQGAGIRLQLEADGATAVANFQDNGAPAILRVQRGTGHIDYCAIPLRPQSFARLIEAVLGELGIERPVRLRGLDGGPVWGVEARSCRVGDDVLVYALNLLAGPVEFDLVTGGPIVAVHDHLAHRPGTSRVRLEGLGTALLRLKTGSK